MLLIFSGIPFGFDFVSVWIEHSYGTGKTFGYRLTLDSFNLLTVIFKLDILIHHTNICSFQGIIIFFALCCKKAVIKNVLEKFKIKKDLLVKGKFANMYIFLNSFSMVCGQII